MSQRYDIAGLDLSDAEASSKLYCILYSAMQQQLERSPAPRCPLNRHFGDQELSVSDSLHPFSDADNGATSSVGTTAAGSRAEARSSVDLQTTPYWDAPHFCLDRVTLFQTATAAEQRAILHCASAGLLQEAYAIEKAGMGYMSRMALMAETTQERMLYTLFAADETSHFVQLSPFIHRSPTPTDHPFLKLLSEVIDDDDKTVLLFVIQVVLEGWGLTHYRTLAKDCTHSLLAQTLRGFLQDESRHHGTGLTLFNQSFSQTQMSSASHAAIVEILVRFLRMVQVGPQGVVEAIAQVKGHLSRDQRVQILAELNTEAHSGSRLRLLRSLMGSEGAEAIVRELDNRGAFRPFAAYQCA